MQVRTDTLKLADVVRIGVTVDYDVATVKQVKDGVITLFRPYVHTADFSYTGGVCCYVGIEEWDIPANGRMVELLRAGGPLK